MPRNAIANLVLPLLLVLMTGAVFQQVRTFELTNLDDNLYVTANPNLESGLSPAGIRWAFTNGDARLWMPVTWLSFLADRQLFGLDAGAFHRTNLLWHLASTLLLYFLLRRMSGAVWRPLLVAALFAVHPLHVESVAWVAERKDVLCGFFFLATLHCYVGYSARPGLGRYLAVLFVFALALMSKPMAVTLPAVLLLLDFRRVGQRRPLRPLLLEKVPLLLLASALAFVTWHLVQHREQGAPDPIPLFERIGHAVSYYALYLGRMFAPVRLSVFYPPEGLDFPWPRIAIWGLLLVSLTGAAWRLRDRLRPVWLGWLAYLVLLAPVSGIVQGGMQRMSDRYFYLPSLGLFVALAWLLKAAVDRRPLLRWPVVALCVAAVLACALAAHRQTGVWRDSGTLFRHALSVNEEDYLAHMNLGVMLDDQGRSREALPHLQRAVALRRNSIHHFNLANVLSKLGRTAEAVAQYRAAVALQPEFPEAHNNLGIALAQMGDLVAAQRHLAQAVEQRPDYVSAWYNLGLVEMRRGESAAAAASFQRTLQLDPNHAGAREQLDSLRVGRR